MRARSAAVLLAITFSLVASRASAQSAEELTAARQLFQEAYDDEKAGRFPEALDKFQRVAKVKETPNVRYRIAAVLESMHRLREAREGFRAAATTPGDDAVSADAAQRAVALDKRIPSLLVSLGPHAPSDTQVTVDGAAVPASVTAAKVEVDPGEHVVAAHASGVAPFETKVTVDEGKQEAVSIPLEAAAPPAPQEAPPSRTLGYVGLGAGTALVVTGVVMLVVRERDVSDVKSACPGDVCPTARHDEIEHLRSEARLFGPLGAGAIALGAVAVAAGGYLLFRSVPAQVGARFTDRGMLLESAVRF